MIRKLLIIFAADLCCMAVQAKTPFAKSRNSAVKTGIEVRREKTLEGLVGKKVGLGTIIIGAAIIVFSGLSAVTLYTDNEVFTLIGTGILIAGIIVGLVISFKAMIKYNKGIF